MKYLKVTKRGDEEELTSWQVGYMLLEKNMVGEDVVCLVCEMDDEYALVNINDNRILGHYQKLSSLYNAYHQQKERLVMARVVID